MLWDALILGWRVFVQQKWKIEGRDLKLWVGGLYKNTSLKQKWGKEVEIHHRR
jgi:hypothetical protein